MEACAVHRARLLSAAPVLILAFATKWYYAHATVAQLRWILAPTASLVEAVSGVHFEYEAGAGYLCQERLVLIAPSCSGMNFLITAFVMLGFYRAVTQPSARMLWRSLFAGALGAFAATLAANTLRICLSLASPPRTFDWHEMHRLQGIIVYFGCLAAAFYVSERFYRRKLSQGLWLYPVAFYYGGAFLVPLLNAGYRKSTEFWHHEAYVLLVPAVLWILCAGGAALFMKMRDKQLIPGPLRKVNTRANRLNPF